MRIPVAALLAILVVVPTPAPPASSRPDPGPELQRIGESADRVGEPALRGAIWNAARGRRPQQVRNWLARQVHGRGLHFVLLQEFRGYVRYTKRHPIGGYRLLVPSRRSTQVRHNPILVKRTLRLRKVDAVRMSRDGWHTANGSFHRPIWAVSVVIRDIRLVSIHNVPSLRCRAGRLVGSDRRKAVFEQFMRKVTRLNRWDVGSGRESFFGGDWNVRWWWRCHRWTPRRVADRTRLRLRRADNIRRAPGMRYLDYALHSVRVPTMARQGGNGGSDHPFITFRIEQR